MESLWETEQDELKKSLVVEDDWADDDEAEKRFIGGVDISFTASDPDAACATLVIIDTESSNAVIYEDSLHPIKVNVPYKAGFLAFREVPYLKILISRMMKRVEEGSVARPFAVMVDGNGILHPRGFGTACHLGVVCGVRTIGVGKSLHHTDGVTKDRIKHIMAAQPPEIAQGNCNFRYWKFAGDSGAELGAAVLPTAACKNPIFISIGHKVSLDSALAIASTCSDCRVPEPVRQADKRSRETLRLCSS